MPNPLDKSNSSADQSPSGFQSDRLADLSDTVRPGWQRVAMGFPTMHNGDGFFYPMEDPLPEQPDEGYCVWQCPPDCEQHHAGWTHDQRCPGALSWFFPADVRNGRLLEAIDPDLAGSNLPPTGLLETMDQVEYDCGFVEEDDD